MVTSPRRRCHRRHWSIKMTLSVLRCARRPAFSWPSAYSGHSTGVGVACH